MRTLCIVRHAKSSWDNADLDDFDRPLDKRGEKDAPRMGKRLQERKVMPDIVYASPATRAWSTAIAIAEILSYDVNNIRQERKLYHADENIILEIVRNNPENVDCIMIVGHNPGLTDFVNDLLNETIANIPTAGIVVAQLNIDSWKKADWKCGKLISFDYPKNEE